MFREVDLYGLPLYFFASDFLDDLIPDLRALVDVAGNDPQLLDLRQPVSKALRHKFLENGMPQRELEELMKGGAKR